VKRRRRRDRTRPYSFEAFQKRWLRVVFFGFK
jgi:hypothetical protein